MAQAFPACSPLVEAVNENAWASKLLGREGMLKIECNLPAEAEAKQDMRFKMYTLYTGKESQIFAGPVCRKKEISQRLGFSDRSQ